MERTVHIEVVPADGGKKFFVALFDLIMQNYNGTGYRSGDARVVARNSAGSEVILDWAKTTDEAVEIGNRARQDLAMIGLQAWCEKYGVRQGWISTEVTDDETNADVSEAPPVYTGSTPSFGKLSEDGELFWNGTDWVSATSADGQMFWSGDHWSRHA